MFLNSFRMPQNRAIHCYLLMSIWILLIIVGVYKFLEPDQKLPEPAPGPKELFTNLGVDVKTKRIFKICNFPENISIGNEGTLHTSKWALKGLLILIRHGDRGPLQHVRKISSINCGVQDFDLLTAYKDYVQNQTLSGKIQWIGPGPFHGFPFLPTHQSQCQLGQLTMQGISQLLKLGNLLKKTYSTVWPKLKVLSQYELIVYSTRYRRTFQSALALLFGLIPHDTLAKINVYESQSMSFCFKDCGCPVTEKFLKNVQKGIFHQLRSHPAVANLAETTGKYLFSANAEQGSLDSDPHSVRDALLSFVCHRSGLPCESPVNCIKRQNVVGIFAYTDWVNYQKWRDLYWKRYCLLKSYGLIRHIVQQMLHMVSSTGPYLVLYSGHDHTVDQLTSALGLQSDPFYLDMQPGLLTNGQDVTRQISFCKNLVTIDAKINLCKIEDIVRFLHDDYFVSLNVTNFKDACIHKID